MEEVNRAKLAAQQRAANFASAVQGIQNKLNEARLARDAFAEEALRYELKVSALRHEKVVLELNGKVMFKESEVLLHESNDRSAQCKDDQGSISRIQQELRRSKDSEDSLRRNNGSSASVQLGDLTHGNYCNICQMLTTRGRRECPREIRPGSVWGSRRFLGVSWWESRKQ